MADRILIGFAESLAGIEVAASLRRADYDVFLFSRETSLTALSGGIFERNLERIIAPEDDIDASLEELEHLWERLGRPPVFPLDDISLWLVTSLAMRRPEIVVIGPRGSLAALALDKARQLEAARRAGFPVLETHSGEFLNEMAFPQFVKGCLAAEAREGRIARTGGGRVASASELRDFTDSVKGSPTLSQPCIDGIGEGIFGIARDGRLLVASGHRRVRMMNPRGSGSSACVSRVLDSHELECTRRFLEATRWNGLFMLEFLRDHAGTSWFMELNGRPWGSMALARAQGLDYPRWAADLDIKEIDPVTGGTPAACPPVDMESRHLGRELIHLAHLLRQIIREGRSCPSLLASLRGIMAPGRRVDYYNLASAGWAIFLRDSLYSLARHSTKTWLGRLMSLPGRALRKWNSYRIGDGSACARYARKRISQARKLVVVCYGNINRSVIAAAALRRAIPSEVTIISCGLHRRCGRPADPMMTDIAKNVGIDLSTHRSRTITSVTVEDADLILVMERWHIVWLHDFYPKTRGKVFLLGLLGEGAPEIPDPFNKNRDTYARVAARIVGIANGLRTGETYLAARQTNS